MASLPVDFAKRIVEWQRVHGRHGLPWQGTRDPYRIWLSEIMLQQTQVSTVLRYYGVFLERFPTVAALAAAPQDDVLAAWSGLGYYSRARNLHRCAQAVMNDHAGVFPTRACELEKLPGIGRSTAAAVAAFSAGERAAILDGNVKRVLARALGVAEDLAQPAALRRLWVVADALLPQQGIEAYTQGLMDLGATVCLPRTPKCLLCPLQADCVAQRQGRPQDFPVKTRRAVRGRRRSMLLVWLHRERPEDPPRLLLCRRPDRGIWAGLWTLPMWEGEDDLQQAMGRVSAPGFQAQVSRHSPVVHALTHLDWTLVPLAWISTGRMDLPSAAAALLQGGLEVQPVRDVQGAPGPAGAPGSARPPWAWLTLEEALALGLPAPVRRLLEDLG